MNTEELEALIQEVIARLKKLPLIGVEETILRCQKGKGTVMARGDHESIRIVREQVDYEYIVRFFAKEDANGLRTFLEETLPRGFSLGFLIQVLDAAHEEFEPAKALSHLFDIPHGQFFVGQIEEEQEEEEEEEEEEEDEEAQLPTGPLFTQAEMEEAEAERLVHQAPFHRDPEDYLREAIAGDQPPEDPDKPDDED